MKQINSNIDQDRLRKFFIKSGVKMIGPETIFFSKDTKIGKKVTINPYVVIGPKVKIGDNVIINSFSHLEDCKIKNKVEVGPYARLRPGTILEEGSKIGNFVEVKKSTVGKKSKINHLSYIGDSELGKGVNVGAGTITCNYDGKKKNKTKIVSKGSSLKFCLVAEGEAEIYPRFAPTMEWDTAAGQAICQAVGVKVIDNKTQLPLRYNKENLLNSNFLVSV